MIHVSAPLDKYDTRARLVPMWVPTANSTGNPRVLRYPWVPIDF